MFMLLMKAMLSVEQILMPITIVKQLVLAAVSAVGIFIIAKGFGELGDALPAKDSSGIRNAVLQIIAGIIVAAMDVVLNMMGIAV